jgi:hypothetical protein
MNGKPKPIVHFSKPWLSLLLLLFLKAILLLKEWDYHQSNQEMKEGE